LDGDWIESDVIEESGIRYLTSGNVGAGFYKNQGSGYISEKTFRDLHCLKVYPGDLMISRLNEPIGRACIIPQDEPYYVVAVDNVILRPNKEFDRKFIMYAMNTEGYAEYGNMIARGATMSRVSRSQLGQFWLAFPDIVEQCAIADFLDIQCTKIDSMIEDIEKQIDILQKHKKSLIFEKITSKKINWKYGRIKDLMTLQRGYDLPQEEFVSGDIPVYGSNGVIGYHNISTTSGPCVTIGRSGSVGALNYVECDFWAHNTAIFISNSKGNHIRYLYYVLQSFDIKELANGSAVPTLDRKKVESVHLYFTSNKSEQREIAKYLDVNIKKIDEIITMKQKQLEIIQKHKKSLIYEYVTGKKRVMEEK